MILRPAWIMRAPALTDTHRSHSCAASSARHRTHVLASCGARIVSNAGCCHGRAKIRDRQPCSSQSKPSGPAQASSSNRSTMVAAAPAAQDGAAAAGLAGLLRAIQVQLQQQGQGGAGEPPGADVEVQGLSYHPAGAEAPLLTNVNLSLPAKRLGLVYGRSGAGKSTLLQLLAGLLAPSSGSVALAEGPGRAGGVPAVALAAQERMAKSALVFQFPERHFLAGTLQEELLFGWPTDAWSLAQLSQRAGIVLGALGLDAVPLETPLRHLSDGYKRRVALAVALVRRPSLLLLDEPLAGLDWRSRADIAGVLGKLKQECTVLVVSHDLRELGPLVDCAWEMEAGGKLRRVQWPPQQPQNGAQ